MLTMFLTGHAELHALQETCRQLIFLLAGSGLVWRKWASNEIAALQRVPSELWETSNTLEIDRSMAIKALGLLWFPQADKFMFKIPVLHELILITKRAVVSEMSRLFDPIGLLAPVVINAKMFVQTL